MHPSTANKPAPIIFGDESLSDVTLVVEQQEFIVHKMFLAARSDVFKAMFYGEFKESKENRIEIKDVCVNSFRRFLENLYTGKTENKPAPIIFGDESLSDVTLVVEQQEFIVHKMFLATRSDVFKVMFYGEFKESKENRIEIKDVSVDTFRRFLEIIYTGVVKHGNFFLTTNVEVEHSTTERIALRNIKSGVSVFTSYDNFFARFWKNTTEILEIADRFNVTCLVKNYLESIIQFNIKSCEKTDCHQCFHRFLFSLIHGFDVSKCQKTYPKSVYQRWLQYAEKCPDTFSSFEVVKHLALKLS